MCSRVSRFLNMSGPSYSIALVSEHAKYCCWGARGFIHFLPFFHSQLPLLCSSCAPWRGGGAFCRFCLLFSHELHKTCIHIHKIHRKNFIGEIVIFFWSLVFALRPTSPVCAGLACVLFSSQQYLSFSCING